MKTKDICATDGGHNGLGAKSAWTVDVDVYLETADDPPKFSVQTCLPVNQDNEIIFNNNGRHGFFVHFHLHDLTDSGYHFPGPPNVAEALWSRQGPGCPPKNYGQQWREFTAERVIDGGMTLVVRNLNESQTAFGYTLRVTNDDEHYLPLDPGGSNQNGNYMIRVD